MASGTDNAIFRLGRDLVVRLPRIGWAVPQIAMELVIALHRVATGGPRAGRRAGPLAPDDEAIRRAILRLRGELDVERALAVWDAGITGAPWDGLPVWVHGDLLPGNVIVREAGRRLDAVLADELG